MESENYKKRLKKLLDAYVPRVIVRLSDQESTEQKRAQFQIRRYESIASKPNQFLGDAWKELAAKKVKIDKLITSVPAAQILKLTSKAKKHNDESSNFLNYFAIRCPTINLARLVQKDLRNRKRWPTVEGAYLEGGPAQPPSVVLGQNEAVAQPHLDSSLANGGWPGGIDARYAWTRTGGDGEHIQFMDIEWGWIRDHVDLLSSGGAKVPAPIYGEDAYAQGHGTCVLGTIVAKDNNVTRTRTETLIGDCIGIAPHVRNTLLASPWRKSQGQWQYSVADAILKACTVLTFGDVLLLEVQTRSEDRIGYFGFPVEVEEAEFQAIKLATDLGIIVIEAAGNRGVDLDGITFQTWTTRNFSLDRSNESLFLDSGAIMVGSAESYTRSKNNNYGSRLDCFAWDDNVRTTGFDDNTGPLPPGTKKTESYVGFGGTSAASAMIAGAALVIQGIQHAMFGGSRYSPQELRNILSDPTTATLSVSSTATNPNADKIGVMPDLRAVIEKWMP